MPARYLWSGHLSFGLVMIPVHIVPAVRPSRVAFTMLHSKDNARLERRMVCPEHGKVVPPEHMIRGFEIEKNNYVTVTDDELDAIAAEKSQTIEITDFVSVDAIDPMYYDRPYYLVPSKGGEKPYRLLVEALAEVNQVGLALFVMHGLEYFVGIRSFDDVLCLLTLHFHQNILPAEEFVVPSTRTASAQVTSWAATMKKEKGKFRPQKYKDIYREGLEELIKSKIEADGTVTAPQTEPELSGEETDELMASLRESLSKVKTSRSNARKSTSHRGKRT